MFLKVSAYEEQLFTRIYCFKWISRQKLIQPKSHCPKEEDTCTFLVKKLMLVKVFLCSSTFLKVSAYEEQ